VQVRDEILLEQTTIPFESKTAPNPNTELDQHSVVQPGQEGIIVTRTRLRYEDGQEINRQVEGEWQARPPQDRIVGFGTKVVIKTAVVDGVAIEYWRSITVFATSYSPCNSDASRCYPNTATGLPVTKGVAGVKRAWFGYLVGQNVFVPGYGVAQIADIGGGYPDGRAHIDLGYSDADYVPWYWWVTIYFLTPVPENILWIMQ
jgi:3D (Asp-Asp-Asp) domain-containing protein